MNDFIYFEESWNEPNLEKNKPKLEKESEDILSK